MGCGREVLVDETREYGAWADWPGVPRHTFSAVFGAVIAQGLDYRETFQVFRPGLDLHPEREARADAGRPSPATGPDPASFKRVAEVTPFSVEEILYVGDRLDNDVRPATEAGIRAALVRRAPWGVIQQHARPGCRHRPGRVRDFKALRTGPYNTRKGNCT
ncbi:HAD family hydrolase [Spongiactinospora sp. 9N601]|uniref:HAD family hydrolase n=1 Tax=Spongiactinospora sp. 9N601 TaxID=3375149 RepID=UPI00378C7D55